MTTKRNHPKVSLEETNLEKSEEVRAGIGQQKDPGLRLESKEIINTKEVDQDQVTEEAGKILDMIISISIIQRRKTAGGMIEMNILKGGDEAGPGLLIMLTPNGGKTTIIANSERKRRTEKRNQILPCLEN